MSKRIIIGVLVAHAILTLICNYRAILVLLLIISGIRYMIV